MKPSSVETNFPLVCRRVLNRDMSIPLTFVVFDLLRQKGVDLTSQPYGDRRRKLERLKLDGPAWKTAETVRRRPRSLYRRV